MADPILATAPDRFALAGLSMGGYLALEIMRRAPARVIRLALCDTSARADTAEQTAQLRPRDGDRRRGQVRFHRAGGGWGLGQLVAPGADAAVRDAVVAMSVRVGPDIYVRQQRAIMARPDSRALLPTIAVPTLVMVGAEDALTPPTLAGSEMAAAIPDARLAMVADAGHLPPMERPARTSALLREWLTA